MFGSLLLILPRLARLRLHHRCHPREGGRLELADSRRRLGLGTGRRQAAESLNGNAEIDGRRSATLVRQRFLAADKRLLCAPVIDLGLDS